MRIGRRTSAAAGSVIPTTASSDSDDDLGDREVDRGQQAPDGATEPGRGTQVGCAGAGEGRGRTGDRTAPSARPAPGPSVPASAEASVEAGTGPAARAASRPSSKSATQVVEILQPDRDAEQPGGDPALGEGRVVELAVGRRRRVDDHREDAAERRGQLRQRQRVDDGPAGLATALELEGEHPAAVPRSWRRGNVVLGMARQRRGGRRASRPPDARASAASAVAVAAWRSIRIASVEQATEREERGVRRQRGAGIDLDARGSPRSGRGGR